MRSKSSRNCRKKLKFPTEARARIVGAIKARENTLWPYECPECGLWHLTSKPNDRTATAIQAGKSGMFS